MYDPSIGRWTSEDPLGFDAGDENLYRYAGNHPTTATDPSGLITFSGLWNNGMAAWSSASHFLPIPNLPQAFHSGSSSVSHLFQGNIGQSFGYFHGTVLYVLPWGSNIADPVVSVTEHGVVQTISNTVHGTAQGIDQIWKWSPFPNTIRFLTTGDFWHLLPFYSLTSDFNQSSANYQNHGFDGPSSWFMAFAENQPLANAGLGVVENFAEQSLHSQNYGQPLSFQTLVHNWTNFYATVAMLLAGMGQTGPRPTRVGTNSPAPTTTIVPPTTGTSFTNFIGSVREWVQCQLARAAGEGRPTVPHVEPPTPNVSPPSIPSQSAPTTSLPPSAPAQPPVPTSVPPTFVPANLQEWLQWQLSRAAGQGHPLEVPPQPPAPPIPPPTVGWFSGWWNWLTGRG